MDSKLIHSIVQTKYYFNLSVKEYKKLVNVCDLSTLQVFGKNQTVILLST